MKRGRCESTVYVLFSLVVVSYQSQSAYRLNNQADVGILIHSCSSYTTTGPIAFLQTLTERLREFDNRLGNVHLAAYELRDDKYHPLLKFNDKVLPAEVGKNQSVETNCSLNVAQIYAKGYSAIFESVGSRKDAPKIFILIVQIPMDEQMYKHEFYHWQQKAEQHRTSNAVEDVDIVLTLNTWDTSDNRTNIGFAELAIPISTERYTVGVEDNTPAKSVHERAITRLLQDGLVPILADCQYQQEESCHFTKNMTCVQTVAFLYRLTGWKSHKKFCFAKTVSGLCPDMDLCQQLCSIWTNWSQCSSGVRRGVLQPPKHIPEIDYRHCPTVSDCFRLTKTEPVFNNYVSQIVIGGVVGGIVLCVVVAVMLIWKKKSALSVSQSTKRNSGGDGKKRSTKTSCKSKVSRRKQPQMSINAESFVNPLLSVKPSPSTKASQNQVSDNPHELQYKYSSSKRYILVE